MDEARSVSFRTALGGFHKGDVADYIAKAAAEHQAKVRELELELEALKKERDTWEDRTAELEALQAENEALRTELLEYQTRPDGPASDREEAPGAEEKADVPEDVKEQELAAYRRAEAAERLAFRRAGQLYDRMQEICGRSEAEFASADASARESLEAITAQMERLRASVETLSEGLQVSARELEEIHSTLPEAMED